MPISQAMQGSKMTALPGMPSATSFMPTGVELKFPKHHIGKRSLSHRPKLGPTLRMPFPCIPS